MSKVRMGLIAPDGPGTTSYAQGTVRWAPPRREVVGNDVRLPAPFDVVLPGGTEVVIDVTPGPWIVTEYLGDGDYERAVIVPDVDAVVQYAHLADVDPATLQPTESSIAAWEAAVETVRGHTGDAASSSAIATDAAAAAEAHSLAAEQQADEALDLTLEAAEHARTAALAVEAAIAASDVHIYILAGGPGVLPEETA